MSDVKFVLVGTGTCGEANYLWACGACGAYVPEITKELHARWHIEGS